MNVNARRQIKDIQFRADHLINGKPSIEDIEEFHQYNEELKKYLLHNLVDTDLLQHVNEIPDIIKESKDESVRKGILTAFLSIFASWLIIYFQQKQRIENSKELIREARGKYATIELLIRNF